MQVKEVMFREVITVKRSTTLRQLLEIFSKFYIFPLVPVVEEDVQLWPREIKQKIKKGFNKREKRYYG